MSPIKAEGNEGGGEEAVAETGGAAQVPAGSDALTAAPASASDTAARAKSEMRSFRAQCEAQCRQELEARLVTLVAEGAHAEINLSVTKTRLYQNLTENAACMGFYDVKNAKLCTIFQGEVLTHREPKLDELDFERFVETVEPLLQPKRDALWVLCGRTTESNGPKVKKL